MNTNYLNHHRYWRSSKLLFKNVRWSIKLLKTTQRKKCEKSVQFYAVENGVCTSFKFDLECIIKYVSVRREHFFKYGNACRKIILPTFNNIKSEVACASEKHTSALDTYQIRLAGNENECTAASIIITANIVLSIQNVNNSFAFRSNKSTWANVCRQVRCAIFFGGETLDFMTFFQRLRRVRSIGFSIVAFKLITYATD